MMRQARRYHLVRAAALMAGLLAVCLVAWYTNGSSKAHSLRDRLLESTTADVPGIVPEMGPYRRWLNPLLRDALAEAEVSQDARKQLHASLALLPSDPGQAEYLYGRLLKAEPDELVVVREALRDRKPGLTEDLWAILQNRKHDQEERFRAACALAGYDPDNPRWEKVADDVAAKIVSQHSLVVGKWVDVFGPKAGEWLLKPLAGFLADEKRSGSDRELIAKVYGAYAASAPRADDRLEKVLADEDPFDEKPQDKLAREKRQANVAAALVVMGRAEKAWALLKHIPPDPTRRSFLIERLGPAGADPKALVVQLEREKDVSIRRALLLSLGQFALDRLPQVERQNLLPRLLALYRDDPDPGIHGAAEWLVRQWQFTGRLREIDRALATGKAEGKRRWYVNGQRQTLVIVPRPEKPFWMGAHRHPLSPLHRRRINRSYAIAAKEVTVREFREFRREHQYSKEYSPTPDCPINQVSWMTAAAYCNWLSEKEGIPKDQWCYEVEKSSGGAMIVKPAANYLHKTGYRLPTDAEWEYACRAGAATRFAFGEPEELLGAYARFTGNNTGASHPVGSLKPNDLGLFDMHGNAREWSHDVFRSYHTSFIGGEPEDKEDMSSIKVNERRSVRGGRSSDRFGVEAWSGSIDFGFRPARTYR
jgi:formylglycine-generating enzyme required for sulfatase activity